jgi:hypothetical protein
MSESDKPNVSTSDETRSINPVPRQPKPDPQPNEDGKN